MAGWRRIRAVVGLAFAQLRYYRARTILAVTGVAVAVLATITLAALGVSILDSGSAAINSIGGDVWVTPSSLTIAPGAVGGIQTDLQSTHQRTREIADRPDVAAARGIHFQTVYVGTEANEYETIIGAGVTGDGSPYNIETGETFSGGDTHYAGGSYNGPFSEEVLIDSGTAELLNVTVGDRIHVGGTIVAANENTFTIVGITDDITSYVGAPTVVLHLSELQRITASTRSDPGSAILVATEDDADADSVRDAIAAMYPEVTVRTAEQQFTAVLGQQADVIGAAVAILLFAVGGGVALVANVFGMVVYHQRTELAALQAVGIGHSTLLAVMVIQGSIVGVAGGAIAVAATRPSVALLNRAIALATGFDGLITVPVWTLGAGGGLAVGVGIAGSLVAGWLVLQVPTVQNLTR